MASKANENNKNVGVVFDNYLINEEIKKYDSFDEIGLKNKILRGIYGYGFEKPSPVQRLAIKPMLERYDYSITFRNW